MVADELEVYASLAAERDSCVPVRHAEGAGAPFSLCLVHLLGVVLEEAA